MQIRCYNCHRPFALKREIVHAALDMMTSQDMSHYDAPCPHCRRVNRVSRDELMRSAPDWKKQADEQAEDG